MNKKVELKDIINFDKLNSLFQNYYKALKMGISLYGLEGNVLLCCKEPNCICSIAGDNKRCKELIVYSGELSTKLKKPYIYETACGLIMCIEGIIVGGECVGYISFGPCIMWDKEDMDVDTFTDKCKKTSINLPCGYNILEHISNVEAEVMTGLAEIFKVTAEYMVEDNREYFDNSKGEKIEIKPQKIQKIIEKNSFGRYPLELERELIAYIQTNNTDKAKGTINKLLAEILLYTKGELDLLRAKINELMAFFIRTAIESGCTIEDVSFIVDKSNEIVKNNKLDYQDICQIIVEILNEYLELLSKKKGGRKVSEHIVLAITHINNEYMDSSLTLESLARNSYLSPYYLSHLFRDEMGTTFKEYLNSVRIENVKVLLKEGLSVENTAIKVGLDDVSYFIKIFKKAVGLTPFQYKKM